MDIGEPNVASGGGARTDRVGREMAAARAALHDPRTEAETSMDEAVRRLLAEISPAAGPDACAQPVVTMVVRSRAARERAR